jgi:hypothetical protein
MVLLAPAWKFLPVVPSKNPPVVRILHSAQDAIIPIEHSRELCSLWAGRDVVLLEAGADHSLNDPESLATLDRVVQELADRSF